MGITLFRFECPDVNELSIWGAHVSLEEIPDGYEFDGEESLKFVDPCFYPLGQVALHEVARDDKA